MFTLSQPEFNALKQGLIGLFFDVYVKGLLTYFYLLYNIKQTQENYWDDNNFT